MPQFRSAEELADAYHKAYLAKDARALALLHEPELEDRKLVAQFRQSFDPSFEASPSVVKPYEQPDWSIFASARFEPPKTHSIQFTVQYFEGIKFPDGSVVTPPGNSYDVYVACAPTELGYVICRYVFF